MMMVTHVFIGMVVAAPLALLLPEHASLICISAVAGGLFPDLDLFIGTHRRTLHYPFAGWSIVMLVGIWYAVTPASWLLSGFVFSLAAVVHATTEPLGGGLERKPWEQKSTKAVFVHGANAWMAPRFTIPYDGAPEDLVLCVCLAPIGYAYPGVEYIWPLIGVGLLAAVIYTLIRRLLPHLEVWLHTNLPVLRPFLNGLHGGEPTEPSDESG